MVSKKKNPWWYIYFLLIFDPELLIYMRVNNLYALVVKVQDVDMVWNISKIKKIILKYIRIYFSWIQLKCINSGLNVNFSNFYSFSGKSNGWMFMGYIKNQLYCRTHTVRWIATSGYNTKLYLKHNIYILVYFLCCFFSLLLCSFFSVLCFQIAVRT